MSYPIVILGSGGGSNALALLQAQAKNSLGQATIKAIISDVEDAGILNIGHKFSIPAVYENLGAVGARLSSAAESALIKRILSFKPELIVLAGFMRILSKPFINTFEGKIINLHPSLLPSFKGAHGIRDAYQYGVKVTGCSVHWVTPALDDGPIIDQKSVRIDPADTLESLEQKIHAVEHQLLPDVVARLSSGKL